MTTFADLQAKAQHHEIVTFAGTYDYRTTAAGECDGFCGNTGCIGHLYLRDTSGKGPLLDVSVSHDGTYH